jgi:hypothetical protein
MNCLTPGRLTFLGCWPDVEAWGGCYCFDFFFMATDGLHR